MKILTGVFAIIFSLLLLFSWEGISISADQNHHEEGAGARQAVAPEKLGEVNFPVSCNAPAQKEFNRAMGLFYSFWFTPAIESFSKVLQYDPQCGMAYWGIALMSMGNPFTWPPNEKAQKTAAAAEKAQLIGAKTQREQDYVAALAVFFRQWQASDFQKGVIAFENAMENLAGRYPQDKEAQILYALILDVTASPADKTFANQLKAGAILEPLFKEYPNHPGAAHFLIHTYDYAELAERALPAARAYAKIAPSVPHALHMPSHIFSRLGLWNEMVEGNRASYLAAKSELKETTLGVGTYDALHAMDYLVFGLLQEAQDKAAKQYVDEVAAIKKLDVENFVAAYALAAIPSRFALERNDWKQAAALALSPPGLSWDKFPQAEAILVFARGLGAARIGDVAAARRDVELLQALRASMAKANLGYWITQTDFQIKAVNAWMAYAEKRNDDAVKLMTEAAELEEATDKHAVTPGNIVPCRELLGEMLMVMSKPSQAFTEFERSLKRDPNRFRSIYGAAGSAEASGNREAARGYYSKLLTITAAYDTERPEITKARAFLNSR